MIALAIIALLSQTAERPISFVRPLLLGKHRFIVCAHRADHEVAPENTLDAIQEAIRHDVDYVELDLRTSKDGTIVIMHDGKVDRTTNGAGPIDSLTLEQIRALKIYGARRPDEHVPTFEECLRATRGKVHIYMDIKAVTPQQVLPLLRRYRMEQSVIAYVYDDAQRAQWRAGAPNIPLISELDSMKSPDQIETDWGKSPFAITDGNALEYKPELVARWHKLGVAVVPDIQNPLESPAQWKPLIDMGVDGLQTDHPSELIAYLKELGIR